MATVGGYGDRNVNTMTTSTHHTPHHHQYGEGPTTQQNTCQYTESIGHVERDTLSLAGETAVRPQQTMETGFCVQTMFAVQCRQYE